MEQLLDPLLRLAQRELEQHGEFYPFGAALTGEGDIRMLMATSGEPRPESQPLIDLLYDQLRDQVGGGGIRASGVCFDVRLHSPDTDAIQVALEHVGADPVAIYLPYTRLLRGTEYGELFATPGQRHVFLPSAPHEG